MVRRARVMRRRRRRGQRQPRPVELQRAVPHHRRGAATLVLLIYLFMFIYRERHEVRTAAEPGSGSVSLKRFRAWMQHYDRKDMSAPHFRQQQGWSDSPSTNGGSSQGRKRAELDEATATRDFGGPRASPLSDHYSRMDSGFAKIFKIPRHIESLVACMEH